MNLFNHSRLPYGFKININLEEWDEKYFIDEYNNSNLGKNYRLWFTLSLILFCRECDDVMSYYIVDVEFDINVIRIRKFCK